MFRKEITNACSIITTDTVVITGGEDGLGRTMKIVSRYGTSGYIEALPSLNKPRQSHGCGTYSGDDGSQVQITTLKTEFFIYSQVLIVAGGLRSGGDGQLDTTEIFRAGSSAWQLTTSLPSRLSSVRGVTIAGVFYITGEYCGFGKSNNIMVYRRTTRIQWCF